MNTIPPRAPVDYLTHLAAYLVRLTHPAHLTRPEYSEYPEYPEYLEYLKHLEQLPAKTHLAAGGAPGEAPADLNRDLDTSAGRDLDALAVNQKCRLYRC